MDAGQQLQTIQLDSKYKFSTWKDMILLKC
uniref:Uncharacterized protein n=1 Tax=Rhizophora mucronata TaxID=61149 RepID=A0A2P2PTJ8_RHIMU